MRTPALILVALTLASTGKCQDTKDVALRAELRDIFNDDQNSRLQLMDLQKRTGADSQEVKDLWKVIEKKDAQDLAKVEDIIRTRGWVGNDIDPMGCTLFLVIQHSDMAVQEKYLPLVQAAVKAKKEDPGHLALLEDRLAMYKGLRQTYGSQIRFTKRTHEPYLWLLDDPDHVDERRKAVGLGPIADYAKQFGITWNLDEYKKRLPELEVSER